jgi:hypothetical protein
MYAFLIFLGVFQCHLTHVLDTQMKIKIDSQAPDFPRDYSLAMIDNESTTAVAAASATTSTTPYYSFKETKQGNAAVPALEGPVKRFFNAKPDNTPEYRAMTKARLAKASTGKRYTIHLIVSLSFLCWFSWSRCGCAFCRPIQMVSATDFDSSIRQSFARTNEIARADGAVAAAVGPARPTERRVRDAERIGPDILQAFREQPYWRLEALSVRVNQPQDFVKENLSRYAKQVTQGEHRYSYELREDYRMTR